MVELPCLMHAGRCSVESVCCRTSQTFSPAEQCGWLRLIHAAYTADTEDKDLALEVVQYTVQGVEEAITVWARDPVESSGELTFLSNNYMYNMTISCRGSEFAEVLCSCKGEFITSV